MGLDHSFALLRERCPLYAFLLSADGFLRIGSWYASLTSRGRAMHRQLLIILSSSARPLIFVVNTLADPFMFFGEACFWAPAIFFVGGGRSSFRNIRWVLFMVHLSGILPPTFFAPTHDTRAWVPKVVQCTIGCWAFHLPLRDLLTFIVAAADVPFAFFGVSSRLSSFWKPARNFHLPDSWYTSLTSGNVASLPSLLLHPVGCLIDSTQALTVIVFPNFFHLSICHSCLSFVVAWVVSVIYAHALLNAIRDSRCFWAVEVCCRCGSGHFVLSKYNCFNDFVLEERTRHFEDCDKLYCHCFFREACDHPDPFAIGPWF